MDNKIEEHCVNEHLYTRARLFSLPYFNTLFYVKYTGERVYVERKRVDIIRYFVRFTRG